VHAGFVISAAGRPFQVMAYDVDAFRSLIVFNWLLFFMILFNWLSQVVWDQCSAIIDEFSKVHQYLLYEISGRLMVKAMAA
jgi:hypothetical protein